MQSGLGQADVLAGSGAAGDIKNHATWHETGCAATPVWVPERVPCEGKLATELSERSFLKWV